MNRIFKCENKKTGDKSLLRLYGGKLLAKGNLLHPGCIDIEVLAFHTMAQHGIGPQLYGVFPDGRLEEYIHDADVLSDEDCKDSQLMQAFARKLARIHCLDLPISRTPRDFLGLARDIFSENWHAYLSLLKKTEIPSSPESEQGQQMLDQCDMVALCDWFKEKMANVRHRVVLVHGDMNRGNALVRTEIVDPDQRLVLLDFEFTSYNYRGTDIGNHFNARTMNVKKFMSKEFVHLEYPTEEERLDFVRAYINELKRNPNHEFDESLDSETQLLLEAELFGAIYDLFMFSWMTKEREALGSHFKSFPIHPAIMMGGFIRKLDIRKALVIDLMHRMRQ